jgi:hypothetical protein
VQNPFSHGAGSLFWLFTSFKCTTAVDVSGICRSQTHQHLGVHLQAWHPAPLQRHQLQKSAVAAAHAAWAAAVLLPCQGPLQVLQLRQASAAAAPRWRSDWVQSPRRLLTAAAGARDSAGPLQTQLPLSLRSHPVQPRAAHRLPGHTVQLETPHIKGRHEATAPLSVV